jgi:ubiquitin-conjugating enzyme E2 M
MDGRQSAYACSLLADSRPACTLQGNICLNILREDWKPVLSISAIVYGLTYLFLVSLAASQPGQEALPW